MKNLSILFSLIGLILLAAAPASGQPLNPPTDLTATAGDGFVDLAWLAPVEGTELAYDDGTSEGNLSIGATAEGDLAVRFTPNVYPSTLTAIKVFFGDSPTGMTSIDWTIWGGTSTGPTSVLATGNQAINRGAFDIVDVSGAAVQITADDFFISYFEPNGQTMNLSWDTNQPSANRSWVNAPTLGLPWQTLGAVAPQFDNNLMIRAIVLEGSGPNARLAELSPSGESRPLSPGEIKQLAYQRHLQGINSFTGAVCLDGTQLPQVGGYDSIRPRSSSTDADLLSYNIYRSTNGINFNMIANVLSPNLTYTDNAVVNGTTYWYYVTAVYTEGESGPSNTATATPISPSEFFDDFEAYTPGVQLVVQNPIDWKTWSGPAGTAEDPFVSNAQAYSGSNSVVIVQNNDLVKTFGSPVSGKWKISFRIYIPTGKAGYFNTMAGFTPNPFNWAMECYLDLGGGGRLFAGSPTAVTFNWTANTWQLAEVIVDLDNNLAEFRFNGTSVHSWQWTLGASGGGSPLRLDASDLFGATADDQMYVDNFSIVEEVCTTGLLGDINGDDAVNSLDALLMLSYDAALPLPQPFLDRIAIGFGDVTEEGQTNSTDALVTLSWEVGFPVPFPVGSTVCLPAPAPLGKSTLPAAAPGTEVRAYAGLNFSGQALEVPVMIDMASSGEKLGSYTLTMTWDPALLEFSGFSGGTTEGFANPVVNDLNVKQGRLVAAHAYPRGAGGEVNVLNARFAVKGSVEALPANPVTLGFSAMAAARSFADLLPAVKVVDAVAESPAGFALDNYPNPFNPVTEIRYQLPEAVEVQIVVYNLLGQKVQTLVNGKQQAGTYTVRWEGVNEQNQAVPSGMYFLRMKAGKFLADRKLLLLK